MNVFCRWVFLCFCLALPAFPLDPADALNEYSRQTWQTENGLPQNTVQAITQTANGYLWFATESGLARFDGAQFTVFTQQNTPALPADNIQDLTANPDGSLYVGTAGGAVLLRRKEFVAAAARPARSVASSNARVNVSFKDHEGVLWIGTDTGLMRVRNGVEERFPSADPLAYEPVLSLFEDRSGDLWVGTDSRGITVLRNQKFKTISLRSSGRDEQARCVFVDSTGAEWTGTSSGLRRIQSGEVRNIGAAEGLSSNVVLAIAEDASHALLAGTPDGLNRISNGHISVITAADGLPEDFVRSIYTDRDGSLWVGTRRGLAHIAGPITTIYTQSNGLGSDLVGAVVRDPKGDLWIGTFRGLARMRGQTITNYTVEDGLSSNVITDLHFDNEGNLWIATQGGGLTRFRDESFVRFGPASGLPETVVGIEQDSAGDFWLAAKNGVYRVARAELYAFAAGKLTHVHAIAYGTNDGLRIAECGGAGHPAIWKSGSGDIWFATAGGPAVLKNKHAIAMLPPPPVVIENVTVDDRSFDPSAIKDIAPGHSRMSFQYAGLSFAAPQKVRYRYRLEGFDRNWIDAGTRRVAYYTSLPPRQYTFRVMAQNGDGIWSQSAAAISFNWQPHFYQTYWFYALLIGTAALAGYGMYRWRVHQVQAQFHAVLNERNRIAREIHDGLAQGLVALSMQLEIVSRVLNSSSDVARAQLDRARVMVRASITDARESIWELRSQSNEQEDLASRLSRLVRSESDAQAVKIHFQVHGTYRPLRHRVEDELFRIAQESLRNALQHASASTVAIELNYTAQCVRLTVADNGCGMDATVQLKGKDGHFGLQGIRERSERINGELQLTSAPDAGTRITVEVTAA